MAACGVAAIALTAGAMVVGPQTPANAAVVPAAPTRLKAVAASATSAKVSWTAVPGATRYELQYSTPSSYGWKAETCTIRGTTCVSTGLMDPYPYPYQCRVRAVSVLPTGTTYSAWSDTASVWLDP